MFLGKLAHSKIVNELGEVEEIEEITVSVDESELNVGSPSMLTEGNTFSKIV